MIPNSEFPGQQRPFRVGLLGTGVIAAPHAQALRSLGSAVELVAVCDRDAAKAKAFQQAFSVPSVFDLLTLLTLHYSLTSMSVAKYAKTQQP